MSEGSPRDWRPGPSFPPPLIELLPAPGDVAAPVPPEAVRPRWGLALLLFALTFLTATTLGPIMVIASRTDLFTDFAPILTPGLVAAVWRSPELLRMGLAFAIPALTILLAHELGHYLACRIYGLPCTLPYFLPVPFNFGTFGAFIKIKAPIASKRQLFDVGIAGPIAGFVVLTPFLLYGIARSQLVAVDLVPSDGGAGILLPGRCLAIELAVLLCHGRLTEGLVVDLHPVALGAWLGLFATALNLLPLGQLDGGHILYASIGRRQRRLALPLWLALGALGFLWWGWFFWCAIVLVVGLYHPPIQEEEIQLDFKRRLLAVVALLLLVLCFIPAPIRIVEAVNQPAGTPRSASPARR